MAKNRPLKTVLDLTSVSPEDQAKLGVNLDKSAAAGTGFAASLRVQDSAQTRTPAANATIPAGEQGAETPGEEGGSVPQEQSLSSTEAQSATQESPAESQEQSPASVQPASVQFDPAVLQSLVQQAVSQNIAPLQQQLTESQARNRDLEEQLVSANQQVEQAQAANTAVENLTRLLGRAAIPQSGEESPIAMPNVNTQTSSRSDVPTGMLAEYLQERDMSGLMYRSTKKGGLIPVYDSSKVDRFALEHGWNKKYSQGYRTLMGELTELGKKNGLFRGSAAMTPEQAKAATTGGNIPGGFLDTLSSIMRVSARPGLIFWQFAVTIHRFDRGLGERVDIPRSRYPDILTDSNQRLLSGSGTYIPIDSSNAPVQTGFVQLQLQEYGRGRPEAPPLAIPTFVEAYSMISLMPILERDLFFDFYNFEDLIIREQWKPTTAVFYHNGAEGTLVTSAAEVATGGLCTRKFLRKLHTWFHEQRIVPLPDGCYGLVLVPRQIEQLKESLADEWEPPTKEDVAELTNMMMSQYPSGENLQIEGYMGKYEQFHIWTTNAFGVANSGLTTNYDQPGKEGVAQETDGASDTTTFRQGYAFGGATAGRGIGGAGVQILYDEKTDFGRNERAIWHCYEGHAPLDVDPTGYGDTSEVPQELRVVKIRTADEAVA
ncbi:MAG: hypothetical protein AAGF93_00215 [Cyanobacteria bacterium P01_H01_bin.105]